MSFNLASWIFAFCYWSLSFKVQISENPDEYNKRLNTVNYVVIAYTISVPLLSTVLGLFKMYKLSLTILVFSNLSLVLSLLVIVWGFYKINSILTLQKDFVANKQAITMHIVAYVFVIITDTT
jgi:hypothetical protein